jgi:hypothetical protein
VYFLRFSLVFLWLNGRECSSYTTVQIDLFGTFASIENNLLRSTRRKFTDLESLYSAKDKSMDEGYVDLSTSINQDVQGCQVENLCARDFDVLLVDCLTPVIDTPNMSRSGVLPHFRLRRNVSADV